MIVLRRSSDVIVIDFNLVFSFIISNMYLPAGYRYHFQRHTQDSYKHLRWRRFTALVDGFQPLTIIAKLSFLDFCRSRGYASDFDEG